MESFAPLETSFHEENSQASEQDSPEGVASHQYHEGTTSKLTTGSLFRCDECSYSGKKHLLRQHKRRCHKTKTHQCDVCDKVYSYACELAKHKGRRHPESLVTVPSECEFCGQLFKSESARQRHKRHAHEVDSPKKQTKKYECSLCKGTFETKDHLQGHINKHFDLKPFKCAICKHTFVYETSKAAHEKTCGLTVKTIQCDSCEKTFRTKRCLAAHTKGAHAKFGYRCDICQKYFKWKSNPTRHMNMKHKDVQ